MSAVVFGGSKGIGREIALSLAERGRKGRAIFINYAHDDGAAEETAGRIARCGARPVLVKGDIGSAEGAAQVVRRIAEQTEHVEQVIHAAVKSVASSALKITPEEFNDALQINGASLLYVVQSLKPLLKKDSSIIFLSSRGSKVAIRGYMPLGAPKALAESLVRYLAVELAREQIRINIITPAALPTDALKKIVPDVEKVLEAQAKMTPMGRNVGFDDVVEAVHFLTSPAAKFITAQELVIDGGMYTRA